MARWTEAQWAGPTRNQGDGDGTDEPSDGLSRYDMVIVHIASGTYDGTISWQHNLDARVSSHIVAARDGRRAQVVDTAVRAWTQSAGNPRCLSIENEGFTPDDKFYRQGWETLTPQQIESNAAFLAWAHKVHGIPLQLTNDPDNGRGLGWHGMGGQAWGGHTNCPGIAIRAQLPEILKRAIEIAQGDDMSDYSEPDPLGPDPDGNRRSPLQRDRDMYAAVYFGHRPVDGKGNPVGPEPWIVSEIGKLSAAVAGMTAPQIDYDKLAAAMLKAGAATRGDVRHAVADGLAGGLAKVTSE